MPRFPGDQAQRNPITALPVEIRPNVGTTFAAPGAGELILDIREPEIVRPAVCAHGYRVAATPCNRPPRAHVAQIGELFCGRVFMRVM
jgi:hypothetical protein